MIAEHRELLTISRKSVKLILQFLQESMKLKNSPQKIHDAKSPVRQKIHEMKLSFRYPRKSMKPKNSSQKIHDAKSLVPQEIMKAKKQSPENP